MKFLHYISVLSWLAITLSAVATPVDNSSLAVHSKIELIHSGSVSEHRSSIKEISFFTAFETKGTPRLLLSKAFIAEAALLTQRLEVMHVELQAKHLDFYQPYLQNRIPQKTPSEHLS